jgi:hypothetical protein
MERDRVPPYVLLNSRTDNAILITFDVSECSEKLLNHFSFIDSSSLI